MPNPIPVTAPAGFAPVSAIGFAEADESLAPVSQQRPLPVITLAAAAPAALAATAAATSLIGPFTPVSGKPVFLTLSGSWSGNARMLRSTDGGITRMPLTIAGAPWGSFTANCCEAVWEESESGAALYLDLVIASGSINYRLAQ